MKIQKFKQLFAKKETATDVTTIDVSEEVETDARQHTRIGWWIVLAGVGGFWCGPFWRHWDQARRCRAR